MKRPLSVGDMVLGKIEGRTRHIKINKLSMNWEGPYLIKEEVSLGTFWLMNKDGMLLPNHGIPII